MSFITDFADLAVILPVVLAVAIMLVAQGWWRGTVVWIGVVGATFAAMLVLKLGFLACGPVFDPLSLHSPSGHTAASAVVAGGFTALLGGSELTVVLVSALGALAIGSSRLELGVHSLPEVLIGAAAGIAGAVMLWRLTGRPPAIRPIPLLAVALAVALLMHGRHLPAEVAITRVAHGLGQFVPVCQQPPDVSGRAS